MANFQQTHNILTFKALNKKYVSEDSHLRHVSKIRLLYIDPDDLNGINIVYFHDHIRNESTYSVFATSTGCSKAPTFKTLNALKEWCNNHIRDQYVNVVSIMADTLESTLSI